MQRFTLEYRIDGQRKWRALSVSKLVPFTPTECDSYRQMIAERQAPKYVPWHAVSLRMLIDGTPQDGYIAAITGADPKARDRLIAGLRATMK